MKWSFKLGEIAGIGIYVHATFLLLLGWVALSYYLAGQSIAMMINGVAFLLALFGIVVLHELGHALTAKRFGIQTRDITLLPIGGVARLERMPDDPKQELWVALAGPAVNVVLAAVLYIAIGLTSGPPSLSNLSMVSGNFWEKLLWVNVSLAAFNLLPAFPMDGGRVLRALLAMRMDYVRATQIAAHVGQGMALLFGFIGLFYNPFLVFIALFVWMGASQEASMVQMKSALGGIPVQAAMIKDFRTLAPADSLERAVDHILAGFQQDFPVVEQGRVVGVLTRNDLLKALSQRGPNGRVEDAMQRQFETADPNEMLETVFARLNASRCHSLPLVRNGQLAGILTMDNVGEFLMVQAALRGARA
ncbi:site-2 protease family protein [candidate division KSB1 bacterium]|nr:MAG: site-2 protease family protein [candidate division KSB1 bacterium]MBC6947433.1 site-2 protease family protein [candidate division KSB1 bacterium]MCE7945193.1 site-2 protease family protein [Chlorobi bacterium CHB1]MDL1874223.1 site-2 protease family protein [Cytophagia bacterium CHB2]